MSSNIENLIKQAEQFMKVCVNVKDTDIRDELLTSSMFVEEYYLLYEALGQDPASFDELDSEEVGTLIEEVYDKLPSIIESLKHVIDTEK